MMMSTGNGPLMFMAASDEQTRRNFWNHHSVNYLESMIQRAQEEAAPNISPEATHANTVSNENNVDDTHLSEVVVTPSKFDDGTNENIIENE